MEKPAITEHAVHDLVRRRWSPCAFADRPVDRETILSLFEAARWAASCYNDQPWYYVFAVRPTADFDRLASCLVEGNRPWATLAPVLALSVARRCFHHNGKPNAHAWHDVGQASAHLALQATALGLAVHQMGGFDAAKAREVLGIPDTHEPVAMIAIGYIGDAGALPQPYRDRETAPRTRKSVRDFVFAGRWGESLR